MKFVTDGRYPLKANILLQLLCKVDYIGRSQGFLHKLNEWQVVEGIEVLIVEAAVG